MFETLTRALDPRTDAIDLLKQDHRKVEGLFAEFDATHDGRRRLPIARRICDELELHMEVEEKIFYETAKKRVQDVRAEINEGFVEHETVRRLIKDVRSMSASDEFFEAKVTVMKELIQHHVKEEEHDMMPKIAKSGLDLVDLGERIQQAKDRHHSRMSKAA